MARDAAREPQRESRRKVRHTTTTHWSAQKQPLNTHCPYQSLLIDLNTTIT